MKGLEKRKAVGALSFQVILTKNDCAHMSNEQISLLGDSLTNAVDDVLNEYNIKTEQTCMEVKKTPHKYLICIECKGKVTYRRTHLWDETAQGHRCQECWYLFIDGRGQEKQVQ